MDRPDVVGGSAVGGDALIHRRPSPAVRRRALPALSTALPDFRQRCPQHGPHRDRHCSAAVRPEGRPTRPVRSTVPVTGRRLGRSRAIGSLGLWWISTIRCGSSWPGDLRGVLACVARGQRPFSRSKYAADLRKRAGQARERVWPVCTEQETSSDPSLPSAYSVTSVTADSVR